MWVEGEGWDPSFISVYLFIQTCWLFYRLGVFAHMERNLYFKKSTSSEAKVAFYRHTVNLGRDDSDMQMSPYLWSDCKGGRLDQVAHEHFYTACIKVLQRALLLLAFLLSPATLNLDYKRYSHILCSCQFESVFETTEKPSGLLSIQPTGMSRIESIAR